MDLNQPIARVMTRDPICLQPESNLKRVEQVFSSHRFRHVPVVKDGMLVGILSKTDFSCFMQGVEMTSPARHEHIARSARVLDLMTAKPVTLPPEATVRDAMTIFSKRDFRAIPITDQGRLIGIFTTKDLFRLISHQSSAPGRESHIA